MQRREFVRLSSFAVLAAAGCGGGEDRSDAREDPGGEPTFLCTLRSLQAQPENVRALVEADVDRTPSPKEARDGLLARLHSSGIEASVDPVAEALHGFIDDDWRDARSLVIDGWVLAETEAALAAAALVSDPTSC